MLQIAPKSYPSGFNGSLPSAEHRRIEDTGIAHCRRTVCVSAANPTPIVFVVDRDCETQESLAQVISVAGLNSATFGSARDFLASPRTNSPCCLVIGDSLTDQEALELQGRLVLERPDMPIIFVSNCVQVVVAVRAMKAGAAEFLTKPIHPAVLIGAISAAVLLSKQRCMRIESRCLLQDRYALLSGREREVMNFVVTGYLNKQIAASLGISEITVKSHRGKVMRKMNADSLPALVNMAAQLGLEPVHRRE